MLFSSITFLYFFLPAVLLLHTLAPQKLKNTVLLASSLLFYAWGEQRLVLLLIASFVFHYFAGRIIEKHRGEPLAKICLWASIAASLALIVYFKYMDFFIGTLNSALGSDLPFLKIALPIGISFYTFQLISYQTDVCRGMSAEKNIIDFGTYISFFPQLIAGPIVRYSDISGKLKARELSLAQFACGVRRFVFGLSKKILLANTFAELTELFRGSADLSVLFFWMYAVAFTLYIYFDFSGYSDMAIGLSKMFGFDFPENFNYPYVSASVTEFWRRWHISLGSWFRDYVYIPLGGNRCSKYRHILNICVVWALTGLWHGASWNFVLWGLYYALLLIIEKFLIKDHLSRYTAISRIYTLLSVVVGFVIFNADSLAQAAADLSGMLGISGYPLLSMEALYYLRSYAAALLAGAFFDTPAAKVLVQRLNGNAKLAAPLLVLEPLLLVTLLLFATGCLVDGSFNPFLYFRF